MFFYLFLGFTFLFDMPLLTKVFFLRTLNSADGNPFSITSLSCQYSPIASTLKFWVLGKIPLFDHVAVFNKPDQYVHSGKRFFHQRIIKLIKIHFCTGG